MDNLRTGTTYTVGQKIRFGSNTQEDTIVAIDFVAQDTPNNSLVAFVTIKGPRGATRDYTWSIRENGSNFLRRI